MAINIGINGFGRIGRLVFRSAINNDDFNVVCVNDLLEINHLAYLLKYDSVHGPFEGSVEVSEDKLIDNGKSIKITAERDPSEIDWLGMKTDVVAECTGIFTSIESSSMHIKAGAKKVVISAPSGDAPMFVMGVNHKEVKSSDLVVSNASCTTNCLAPLVYLIDKDNIHKKSETKNFRFRYDLHGYSLLDANKKIEELIIFCAHSLFYKSVHAHKYPRHAQLD